MAADHGESGQPDETLGEVQPSASTHPRYASSVAITSKPHYQYAAEPP
jgi:hypothetical protein